MNLNKKQSDSRITPELLQCRVNRAAQVGFGKQKWVEFCEILMAEGFKLTLYEARKTFSKYITVRRKGSKGKAFKVRFSNHKPIRQRELNGDCDFFVGISHTGVTTTRDALNAVRNYFAS